MLKIDTAGEQDVPEILRVRHAAFSTHAPSAYSEFEVETLLGDIDEGELRDMIACGQLFVARRDDKILGLAGWREGHLRHVYVDPHHTRQRIATRLLDHVEADFRARTEAETILAGVALHAEPFYLASGYVVVRQAVAWDGSAYLEMIKRLR